MASLDFDPSSARPESATLDFDPATAAPESAFKFDASTAVDDRIPELRAAPTPTLGQRIKKTVREALSPLIGETPEQAASRQGGLQGLGPLGAIVARSVPPQAEAVKERGALPVLGESVTRSLLPEGFTRAVSPFVQRMILASQLDPDAVGTPENFQRAQETLQRLSHLDPNSTEAGVAQAGTEFVRQNINPLNIGLAGVGSGLGLAAKGYGPGASAARLGLRSLGLGYGAQMAQTAGEQAGAASVPQPGQTDAQRAAAWTAPVLTGIGSLAATASAFAPMKPVGPLPEAVWSEKIAKARNVTPEKPLALPEPKKALPAPAEPAPVETKATEDIGAGLVRESDGTIKPAESQPIYREGQEVTYSLPDGQQGRGIVSASTANGRVKLTTQSGETLRVPIARVSEVAPEATKAPEGFDAATAEPDIEVSLSEPDKVVAPPSEIAAGNKDAAARRVNEAIVDQANQLADIHGSQNFPRAKLDEEGNIDLTDRAKQLAKRELTPRETRLLKRPSTVASLAEYFKPGNIVEGYGGQDQVVAFNPGEKGQWSVTVRAIDGPQQEIDRTHSTFPGRNKIIAALGRDRYLQTQDPTFKPAEKPPENFQPVEAETPDGKTVPVESQLAGGGAEAPFSLETLTPEQQAAEATAKREQAEAKARQDKIQKLSDKPLTGDSSNVAQGQIFSGDEDLFSGESLERTAAREPGSEEGPAPRSMMSVEDRALMRAEEMPMIQKDMSVGGYTLRDLFVGKRKALANAGLRGPLRLQSPSAAAEKGSLDGELRALREGSMPFSWFHNKGMNIEDGLMEQLNELGFDAKTPEEAIDMVTRAAAGEDVHPTGSTKEFRDQRGAVDERILRALAVTGAAGGGAAYGYSQGDTPEDRIRKAIGYGAAAGVAAYILSKIPAAFADSATGGMAVAMRAAKNSLENAVIGGKDLPNMRAASEPATNAAFRLANSRIFGVQQGLNLAAKVLGDHWNDPVFAEKLGSVLVQEMQEAKIIQLHDALAAAKTPGEKAKIQAQIDRVKPVWEMPATQINSPEEFRDALADPEIQAAIERHKKLVQATAEQIHVELGGKLAAPGPNTGAFINTEAILAGDDLPGAANKGDLQNVLKRKSTFGKERTGTADQYEIDYNRQVARMAAGNAERIAKKDYYDTLENEGLAKVTQPGERPADAEKFRRERTQELSISGRLEDTWIRRDIFGEHRQLMNTDSPLDNHMAVVVARLMNTVQLKSVTDPTFHIANIISSIAGAQGGGSRLADFGRQMPGVNVADALVRVGNRLGDVSKMDPQTREDLAEIARVGALREGHPGIVNSIDRAGRLVMNDLFQNLVDEGLAKDSEGNRRDFVNQIGQYNGRLMGKLKALFKEIGVAPFVVAGQNFNRLGVQRLLQRPGVEAANKGAAAKMTGTAIAGTLASLVAAPAIFNYLANRDDDRVKNKLLGPSGTPVGAIGWQDADANGKPGTLHYVDPLKWTNLRRGARITGLNAVASGVIQGRDLNHTAGQAWEDIRNGAVQPWAGPAINAFSILQTGKNAAGFQEAEVANPLDRTQAPTAAQAGKNAEAALAHLQPQVAAFLQGGRDKNPANFDTTAGAKGVVKSLARAGGYFERNPVDAEHGAAEHALYSEELGREQRREQIQKLAGGWSTMTQPEKVKATDGMSELDGKDLVEALHQNSLGFTSADRMIHSMGVEDGARAKYLAEQVMKLSPAEQLHYLDDKDRKGLITDNVSEQLVEELKARGFRAPAAMAK